MLHYTQRGLRPSCQSQVFLPRMPLPPELPVKILLWLQAPCQSPWTEETPSPAQPLVKPPGFSHCMWHQCWLLARGGRTFVTWTWMSGPSKNSIRNERVITNNCTELYRWRLGANRVWLTTEQNEEWGCLEHPAVSLQDRRLFIRVRDTYSLTQSVLLYSN